MGQESDSFRDSVEIRQQSASKIHSTQMEAGKPKVQPAPEKLQPPPEKKS